MAYEGSIDFLELPFGGVEWHHDEIRSPWAQGAAEVYHTTKPAGNIELKAIARRFDIQNDTAHEFLILYDIPRTEGLHLMCIVMGWRKEDRKPESARHYVLFIAPKRGATQVYERVGVGYMPGKFIQLNTPGRSELVSVR
jgi:hypothetical protein